MKDRSEGAGRRGEATPSQAGRPDHTQTPQQRGEGGERQPLPGVWDILERRAQLYEDWERLGHAPRTRPYRELRGQCEVQTRELRTEAASLYPWWSVRDQLIFDLYAVSGDWAIGLSPQETREFMACVAPLSVEELRKAKAAAERKAAIAKKRIETRERQKSFPPEERKRLRNERARDYQRRKKESRFQAEKPQPTQVFPPPNE